jgi:hypothetical protein
MNEPSLNRAILCSAAAAICFTTTNHVRLPGYWSALLLLLGIVFAGAAFVYAVDYLVLRFCDWREAWRRASIMTEQIALLEALERLSSEHLRALKEYSLVIKVRGGFPEPAYLLQTANGEVPYGFIVREFLPNCTETHLAPVRNWSEGSEKRAWAEDLTRLFILMGFARPAGGHYPARWINREAAMQFIDCAPAKQAAAQDEMMRYELEPV